jgi:hypothetical protein
MCAWVAISPGFRTESVMRNYFIFYINLISAALNAVVVAIWIFNWVAA